jgi:TRAP-type C4-dicarboxylate transport system permease small subunit
MLIAYIDTALGSMLLQAMAGMIFAAMVIGRRVLAAPLAWMSSKNSAQATDTVDLEE